VYVLPTRTSPKSHEILRKLEPKWVITLLVKRYIPPNLNTWVNTVLFLALSFYVNPSWGDGFGQRRDQTPSEKRIWFDGLSAGDDWCLLYVSSGARQTVSMRSLARGQVRFVSHLRHQPLWWPAPPPLWSVPPLFITADKYTRWHAAGHIDSRLNAVGIDAD